MEATAISTYNRAEQRAYWINLYNAATVELILSRYPVKSIRDINISPGLISSGPWGAKISTVEGEKLSLDDIEHRILRPIWKDNRIHYAVNCGQLGSVPTFSRLLLPATTRMRCSTTARVNSSTIPGVSPLNGGKLKVSSIYVWFQEDFGSAEGLMQHWQQYANPKLTDALEKYNGGLTHDFDWRLNGADLKP